MHIFTTVKKNNNKGFSCALSCMKFYHTHPELSNLTEWVSRLPIFVLKQIKNPQKTRSFVFCGMNFTVEDRIIAFAISQYSGNSDNFLHRNPRAPPWRSAPAAGSPCGWR